jgi:hypothetical protein
MFASLVISGVLNLTIQTAHASLDVYFLDVERWCVF